MIDKIIAIIDGSQDCYDDGRPFPHNMARIDEALILLENLKKSQTFSRNPIGRLTFDFHEVFLENNDTDINVYFPNGKFIQLQYRLEAPSLDVCMPTQLVVTNWDKMQPAPQFKDLPHVRQAEQLVIDIPPDWTEKNED